MHNIPLSLSVALLIDADNVKLDCLPQILKFASQCGNLTISRAYGDWNKPPLSADSDKVDNLKIVRIQVDRSGKNATDHELMIEAGELLGEGIVDLFIIVSGDADLRQLCERIRQKGRKVVGIGNKKQSSDQLQKACDEFHFVEDLDKALSRLEQNRLTEAFATLVYRALELMPHDNEGWTTIAELGIKLRDLCPDYEKRYSGKLSVRLRELVGEIEVNEQRVRIRRDSTSIAPSFGSWLIFRGSSMAVKPDMVARGPISRAQ